MMKRALLKRKPRLQHNLGAALLSAMLTVTLVATFAAAALWQQWRSVEVEIAERGRVQVAWLLIGALDWSRLILRIDGQNSKTNNADHLAEPWAVALEESRLSTFLAADKNNTGGLTAEEQVDAFLSGGMVDAQSKLNVTNLIANGVISPVHYAAFKKLFIHLNLPETELETFTENLRNARSTNSPITTVLMPERVRQLTWLGLSKTSLTKLTPFITLLPIATTVNLNTAAAEVIHAIVPILQLADAKNVVNSRESKHFESLQDVEKIVPTTASPLPDTILSVTTQFFEVSGRIRLEQTVVEEQSLVQRDAQNNVKTLWRERAVVAAADIVSNNSVAKP